MATPTTPLLEVRDLQVHFARAAGLFVRRHAQTIRAVQGVQLTLQRGQTLGLVGESGCGKSTTGRAILQLLRPTAGTVHFDGQELVQNWTRTFGVWRWQPVLRQLRRRMQMVFQDPYASLDPRWTVHDLIAEPLAVFDVARGAERTARVMQLLDQVGLERRMVRRYAHEFSGGQRQRIGIARALALGPDLIVADEPISALDVSIQAQILNLMQSLQKELGLAYLFIAHDLAAVRHLSHHVAVMYLGRVVESAPVDRLYDTPLHPYTRMLLAAVPRLDGPSRRTAPPRGDVPAVQSAPQGCPFHPRCAARIARCATELPRLLPAAHQAHHVACHVAQSEARKS